jgi:hypothetical protein
MSDFFKKQQLKELFINRDFKAGDKFLKQEKSNRTSTLEILSYLGKQYGIEDAYIVKTNISYFQDGKDYFCVKTGKEIKEMNEREKYIRV